MPNKRLTRSFANCTSIHIIDESSTTAADTEINENVSSLPYNIIKYIILREFQIQTHKYY